MSKPLTVSVAAYADVAHDLLTCVASLLPRDASDVPIFLEEAAAALGEPYAGLARRMGVSRATLASWKNRGSIPPTSLQWFKEEFASEVLSRFASSSDTRHAGIRLALRLFRETDFDPFDLGLSADQDRIEICYRHLDGLARLGLFIQRRTDLGSVEAENIEAVATRMLRTVARGASMRILTVARGSQ